MTAKPLKTNRKKELESDVKPNCTPPGRFEETESATGALEAPEPPPSMTDERTPDAPAPLSRK